METRLQIRASMLQHTHAVRCFVESRLCANTVDEALRKDASPFRCPIFCFGHLVVVLYGPIRYVGVTLQLAALLLRRAHAFPCWPRVESRLLTCAVEEALS